MQLKLLLETLDRLDEGLFKKVQAAVELEPDPGRRAMILAKMARDNNLPGLYDPVDGTYYNIDGERERSPDNAVTAQLGKLGLVPPNAKTSMFGLWGADDVKTGAVSQSASLNTSDERDEKIARLNVLIKKVSRGLKESRSMSDVLYESFFGLDEDEQSSEPNPDAEYSAYSLRPLDRDIEEMKKLMAELGALNKEVPNSNIDSVLERAQEVIDRASKKPDPPKPPVTPPVTPAPPPSVSPVTPAPPPSVSPNVPTPPATTPTVDPRLEKIKTARELFDKVKSTPIPGPIGPQTGPVTPPNSEVDKKWPTTDEEIRAFQKSKPPLEVDGLIGSRTFKALVAAGYTPPPGFKPVSDKQRGNRPNPKPPTTRANDDATGTDAAINTNQINNVRDALNQADRNADWNNRHNAAIAALDPNAPNPVTPQSGPTITPAELERLRRSGWDSNGRNTWDESIESSEDNRILDQIKNVRF